MLSPVAAIAGALVHRGAHAVATLLLGGDLVSAATGDVEASQAYAIALAPTVAWVLLLAAIGVWVAASRPGFVSRVLVVYGFGLALLDASWGAAGLFLGFPGSDWYGPLHAYATWVVPLWAIYAAALSETGWRLASHAFKGRLPPLLYTGGVIATLLAPWVGMLALLLA